MTDNTTGLIRTVKIADYSWRGLCITWTNEAAFRQEGVAVLLATIITYWLDMGTIICVLLISSVMLVVIVGILDGAIEAVIDQIDSEYHKLSGHAKNIGSTAVLIAVIVTVITWYVLLWSHFG